MAENLLFEIGTEEIPAKFMPDTLEQVKNIAQNKLNENRIAYKNIKTFGTPRRIALIVEGLEEKQADLNELVKGPSKKVAFDENNQMTKAAQGFLRSQGVEEKDIIIDKVGEVEYIFIKKHVEGGKTKELLKVILPEIISSISFPKSMRWKDYNIRFARPIRWITALFGSEVIEFSIEGASSGNKTRGHRTLSNVDIELKNADEYVGALNKNFVMVDQDERSKVIVEQINKLASEANGRAIIEEDLLEEVIYLVEYPTALMGSFEDEFLELPKEAVITPMKEHQRYFPMVDNSGKLMPNFITIRNGNAEYLATVKVGNERVLRARLKDAQFFYNEDLKEKLENKVEKLKTIVYQEKLGTIFEKVERIGKLAEFIANRLNFNDEQKKLLQRAVYLSKADLVTGMVGEFDELQGIMGKEYAIKSGEKPEIAEAIASHYLPRFSGDEIPKDIFGQIISISDKLDSIVGSFGIGVQPTGSQDPYGLRRQAIGIINVILYSDFNINIDELITYASSLLKDKLTVEEDILKQDLLKFFKQRLKINLTEKGFKYDIIDAVLSIKLDNIKETGIKVVDISKSQEDTENFKQFLTAIIRVSNLVSKAENCSQVDEDLFENQNEHHLYKVVCNVNTELQGKIDKKQYFDAIGVLYELIRPINEFFETTMVLVENEKIKNNRLALLRMIIENSIKICDFTKINLE